MTRILLIAAALLVGSGAHAQGARPFAAPAAAGNFTPPGAGSLGTVTVALALVLVAIFAAAWLLRRLRGFGRGSGAALEVLADLPVGHKERAVLIRVGARQILIGVAPGRVSTLHVLPEPLEMSSGRTGLPAEGEPGGALRPSFKSLLMKSLGRR